LKVEMFGLVALLDPSGSRSGVIKSTICVLQFEIEEGSSIAIAIASRDLQL